MRASQLVRIIDAAKRATGQADPELVFMDGQARDPKALVNPSADWIDGTYSREPEKRIDRHLSPNGRVVISLDPEH